MIHKTRGIVLRTTRYGDTSLIASIFTADFGLQSYIIQGVRTSSAKSRMALFQPLTMLDMVVYHKDHGNIQRIREVSCRHAYQTVHQDMRKSAIAMFLQEVVNRTVRDQSHPEELCDFLLDSFIQLDKSESPANFHLFFLLRLSRHLGFGPQTTAEILEGKPVPPELSEALESLLRAQPEDHLPFNQALRRDLLQVLLGFYKQHQDSFGNLHSVEVLTEIFA